MPRIQMRAVRAHKDRARPGNRWNTTDDVQTNLICQPGVSQSRKQGRQLWLSPETPEQLCSSGKLRGDVSGYAMAYRAGGRDSCVLTLAADRITGAVGTVGAAREQLHRKCTGFGLQLHSRSFSLRMNSLCFPRFEPLTYVNRS